MRFYIFIALFLFTQCDSNWQKYPSLDEWEMKTNEQLSTCNPIARYRETSPTILDIRQHIFADRDKYLFYGNKIELIEIKYKERLETRTLIYIDNELKWVITNPPLTEEMIVNKGDNNPCTECLDIQDILYSNAPCENVLDLKTVRISLYIYSKFINIDGELTLKDVYIPYLYLDKE